MSEARPLKLGPGLWPLVGVIVREQPWRAFRVFLLLIFSGLSEGIGLVSLLPLLGILGGGDGASSGLTRRMEAFFALFGWRMTIGLLLALIVVGLALKGALFLWATRQAGYLGSDVSTRLRSALIDSLAEARWSYFVTQPSGRLTNALGIEAMRAAQLTNQVAHMGAKVLQVPIYLALAVVVSWQVTLAALVFGGLMFLLLRGLIDKARSAARSETTLLQSLIARVADGLAVMKSTKAMARERELQQILIDESQELGEAQKKQIFAKAVLPAVQEPVVTLALAVGVYFALRAYETPIAELLFLAVLFQRVVTRMGAAQTLYQGAVTYEPAFRSVVELVEDARAAREARGGDKEPKFEREIRFVDVSFTYDSRPVLQKLSFSIAAGAFVSIAGPSGVGKSTLIDLIVGLLTPSSGAIYVDDSPLDQLDLRLWRHKVGYVSQDPVLLHETVLTNITLQDRSLTEAQALRALDFAGAKSFVDDLPDGIQTVVGERGVRLSGGQRQRLAIARALVHDPALLLLDEATTALDPETERGILETISTLSGGLTVVAISHQRAVTSVSDMHLTLTTGHELREDEDRHA